ncbi:MAG: Spy/CpxP family protein refolding chaperone [Burkholderiaceae bacterium]|jgi:Spy/CpxP family protein refolding chaperone|nr:Spy/CpxP family protein refolding chaperone [Burkholderiaceae bacterium]MDH5209014.1 Spy/CpxP family protein refolding chaperone [Burkholderiaceae bacterium]
MKRMNLRKALSAGFLVGATAVAASAVANPPQGTLGPDYGMGPGMMGGYGMGPGMMGGYAQGSGYGMGPGMMDGYGSRADLNLTAEQRGKIASIRNDVRRKHWELMGKMQDEQAKLNEQYYSDQRDDAPLSKSYRDMSELRQQMFDLSLRARRQIDAVLTQEQRDKLKHG